MIDLGKDYFVVTEGHIKLLRRLNVKYSDFFEFGAPEIDPKRPYGNSYVYGDLGELLGIEPEGTDSIDEPEFTEEQEKMLLEVHKEMKTVLQILVHNLCIEPGAYWAEKYGGMWTRKDLAQEHNSE